MPERTLDPLTLEGLYKSWLWSDLSLGVCPVPVGDSNEIPTWGIVLVQQEHFTRQHSCSDLSSNSLSLSLSLSLCIYIDSK